MLASTWNFSIDRMNGAEQRGERNTYAFGMYNLLAQACFYLSVAAPITEQHSR
jgi:hypothetical protein